MRRFFFPVAISIGVWVGALLLFANSASAFVCKYHFSVPNHHDDHVAVGAAFDCFDPILTELDEEIYDVIWRASNSKKLEVEYTEWLRIIRSTCILPESSGGVEEEWRSVACVVRAYYEKLEELKGPQTLRGAAPPGQFLDFVHPFCLDFLLPLFGNTYTTPFPLDLCNRAYSHIPVERDGMVFRASIFGRRATYKIGGWLDDGTAVLGLWYGGGSTTFASIIYMEGVPRFTEGEAITPESNARLLQATGRGGCRGGLADIEVVEGNKIRLSRGMTPNHFVQLRTLDAFAPNEEVLQRVRRALKAGDLPYHDRACIGTYEVEFDAAGPQARFLGVTMENELTWQAFRPARYRDCFNEALRETVSSFPKRMTPEDIETFFLTFETRCLGGPEE